MKSFHFFICLLVWVYVHQIECKFQEDRGFVPCCVSNKLMSGTY